MFPFLATRFLSIWIVCNITVVVLWDVTILAFGLEAPTVSFYLYDWGRRFPLLYLWLGIGIGHIMMPLVLNGAKGP